MAGKKPTAKPISLRAYARHRKVSPEAVSKAVSSGRLQKSVTRVGKHPAISDPALADEEWAENTVPREPAAVAEMADLLAARVRKERAQASLAELELAKERGEMVPLRDFDDRLVRFVASSRAQLLAVIGDIRAEVAGLTRDQLKKIDALVRRRLDATADAGEAGEL